MKIYKPKVIAELESLYGDLLFQIENFPTIKSHLFALAKRMHEGIQNNELAFFSEINNYHSDYLGTSIEELQNNKLNFEDCKKTIANEYGFTSWELVEKLGDLPYDLEFENSVNTLLEGSLDLLKKQIEKNPYLLFSQSRYGHEATLLHYVASNGVEFWRQKVPMNLPEITSFLLEKGADKNATMKVYNSEFATLPLLASSAHPFAAGIGEEMKRILEG